MSQALRQLAALEAQALAVLGAPLSLAALREGDIDAEQLPAPSPWQRDHHRGRAALARVLERLGRDDPADDLRFPHPRFSLSHSGDWAIAAGCAQARGVGVDLEFARPMDPRTARFFLAGNELAYVDALPTDARPAEMLRLWTAKEAVFKACATNAGMLLTDFILDDPGAHAGMARSADGSAFRARYLSIDLGAGWLSLALADAETAPATEPCA